MQHSKVNLKKHHNQIKVCIRANVAHQAGAYPGFCSMKRLGVFLLPLDGMLVHRRVTSQH